MNINIEKIIEEAIKDGERLTDDNMYRAYLLKVLLDIHHDLDKIDDKLYVIHTDLEDINYKM